MDDAAASAKGTRAGSRALSVFAHPVTGAVLRAHANDPQRLGQIEDTLPWAPQTSLRAALRELRDIDAVARSASGGERGTPHELTPFGRDLLKVGDALERWLQQAPGGPISLTDPAGPSAVNALVAGWDSAIVRELAERPLTHTELSARLADHSHHALGRRLAKLRSARLLDQLPPRRRGRPFEPIEWLRRSIAPLCVAARCERAHLGPEAGPIDRVEIEAAFLLTLPLVSLDLRTHGSCDLAVTASSEHTDSSEVAGVTVAVKQGTVVSCLPLDGFAANTRALGDADDWLAAVVDGHNAALTVHGEDERLPLRLAQAIHESLFSP